MDTKYKIGGLLLIALVSFLYGTGIITGFTVLEKGVSPGDFVQLSYIITLTDGTVVDTSIKEVGETAGFVNRTYASLIMNIIKPTKTTSTLNDELIGLAIDESKTVNVPALEAFGVRNPSLIIPLNRTLFDAQNLTPQIGGRVSIQNTPGTIVDFDDAQVVVDFNNPYAGQSAVYEVTVERIWRQI